jgi:hypothetical protein
MSMGIWRTDQSDVYDSAMNDDEQFMTDPCRAENTFSGPRFLAFTLLFVVMFGGGFTLFVRLGDAPYSVQLASTVSYTAAVMIYGFARNRGGIQPYLFTCPVVMSQYPRLLGRHAGYLAVLIVLETIALRIKPHLSAWWFASSGRGMAPFFIAVALPCGALALTETMTNRGVLERAHRDRFGEYPETDEPEKDKPLSIFGRD